MKRASPWITAAALAVASAGLAAAQTGLAPAGDPATLPRDGRYTMTPTPDGFLRLDTRSGAVSICRTGESGVQCRAAADDRAALDSEIDRLTKENAELRRKLAAATDQAPSARLRNALPSDEEVNKAMGWMEQFMRRMMRVLREDTPPGDRL
ncbi:MAG: hypothetical protein JWN93_369 [Hyphomicrobiales bacterium]|nr:hypothetical protein [Hyphomicrobiales bacterium]